VPALARKSDYLAFAETAPARPIDMGKGDAGKYDLEMAGSIVMGSAIFHTIVEAIGGDADYDIVKLDIGNESSSEMILKWHKNAEIRWITGSGKVHSIERDAVESPFEVLRKRIVSFFDLEQGWDTYSAQAPSEFAIANALRVLYELEQLDDEDTSLEWVVPTGDESVLLQYKVGDTIYHWQFDSDGDVAVMVKPVEGEPVYLDVAPPDIAKVLDGFMHATAD
jgi:hypothetical protein